MTEDDYTAGMVKQDPATGLLAMRTALPGDRAWRVFRNDAPPHFVAHADIEAWPDLNPV